MKRTKQFSSLATLLLLFFIIPSYAQDCSSAQECYQKGQSLGYTEEAVSYFTKAESLWTELEGKEKMLYILNARGNTFFTLKNYPKAIQDYNKIIQLNPESNIDLSDAYNSRGNVMAVNGNLQGAIASYTKAIEIAPPKLNAIINRALAYKNSTMQAECIADYKQAAELGSSVAISHLYYDFKTDHRPAQKTALAADKGWQDILQLKSEGSALIKSGDLDGALKKYVEAEALYRIRGDEENNVSAIVEQAYIYRLKKNYTNAISTASRAASSSYPTESAYTELGYALFESGDQVAGFNACSKGLQKFPNSKEIPGAMAWMYATAAADLYVKKDYVTAYNLYFSAYRTDPNSVAAIKMAGHSAYQCSMFPEALNAYYIALGMDPSLQAELGQYIDYLKTVVK